MKVITSFVNPYIKELSKLKQKKYRDLNQLFLIEGYHLVHEAKLAKCLKTVLIVNENDRMEDVENIVVTREIICKLSQTQNPQNIIGVCSLSNDNHLKGNRFLLLDDVSDPGNLGTLIRSALGFNIDQMILGVNCVDLYNDKVIRATQGAFFKMSIIQMPLEDAILKLKKDDVYIIGTSLKNAKSLDELPKLTRYAIILGNEALGVKEELLQLTDVNVKIKMNEKLESLNVAIAGSIIMYYLGVMSD